MENLEQLKKARISESVSSDVVHKNAQGEIIKSVDPELSKEVINDILKGNYADNYGNKKKGRVGQQYGGKKKEDPQKKGKIGKESKDFSKPKTDKPTVDEFIDGGKYDKMSPDKLQREMDHHKNLAELTGDAGHAQVYSHLSGLHKDHYAHEEGDGKQKKELASRKGQETKAANIKAGEKKKKESADKRATKKEVKAHSNYAEEDYKHLSKKGYSDKEILGIWGEDKKAGKGPIDGDPKDPNSEAKRKDKLDPKDKKTVNKIQDVIGKEKEVQAAKKKEVKKPATGEQKKKAVSDGVATDNGDGTHTLNEDVFYIEEDAGEENDILRDIEGSAITSSDLKKLGLSDSDIKDLDGEGAYVYIDSGEKGEIGDDGMFISESGSDVYLGEAYEKKKAGMQEDIKKSDEVNNSLGILGVVEKYQDDPDIEFEKGMGKQYSGKDAPVGWVNAYGKQKISPKGPNNWKYVGKQHAGKIIPLGGTQVSATVHIEHNIPNQDAPIDKKAPSHIDPADVQAVLDGGSESTPKIKLKELIDVGIHDPSKLESLTKLPYEDIVAYMDKRKIKKAVDDLDITQFNNLPEVAVEERWATYKVMLNMVAHGIGKSLIAYGTGGVGKTWNMKNEFAKADLKEFKEGDVAGVSDYQYIKVTGYQTPKALFKNLYEHNGKIIVFDDCDKALLDETSVNLLKGALDTTGDGTIEYGSSVPIKGSDGEIIPNRFNFNGRIAFISNLDAHKMPQPLRSRAFTVDLTMDAHETVEMLRTISDKMEFQNSEGEAVFVSPEDRAAAINFVDKYKDAIDIGDLNARTLGQIALIKKQIEAMGAEQMKLMKITNWENVAVTMLK